MKVIRNKIIPFGTFKAVNLFGYIFTKQDLNDWEKRHEEIHTEQMKELWYIPYYIMYVCEFLIRLPLNKFRWVSAYRSISFEAEAYSYQGWIYYLNYRRPYEWKNFICKKYMKTPSANYLL